MTISSTPETVATHYDVHLFAVVRLKVSGIAAVTPADAIEAARQAPVLTERLGRFQSDDCDFAEEFSHFLVDVVGDTDFRQSRFFYSLEEPFVTPLAQLVDWADSGRNPERLETLLCSVRDLLAITV